MSRTLGFKKRLALSQELGELVFFAQKNSYLEQTRFTTCYTTCGEVYYNDRGVWSKSEDRCTVSKNNKPQFNYGL